MLGSFALIFDKVSKILDSTRPVSSSAFSSSVVSSEELLARSSSSRILSRIQLKGSMNFPPGTWRNSGPHEATISPLQLKILAARDASILSIFSLNFLAYFLMLVISDQNRAKIPFGFGVSTRSSQRNWTQLIQNIHGSAKSLRN